MDFLYICILGYLFQKLCRTRGFGDYLISCLAAAFVFCIPKGLILGCFWGWTFPFTQDLRAHIVSGTISFICIASIVLYRITHPVKKDALDEELEIQKANYVEPTE